jgi:hypothetical protein
MEESYTITRAGIIVGSLVATYLAYALGHAIWAPLGAPFAAAAGYGLGIVAHKYWGS